jgi:hypothetical protein
MNTLAVEIRIPSVKNRTKNSIENLKDNVSGVDFMKSNFPLLLYLGVLIFSSLK